jgi:dTDP-4-dehydrorhamnose reductase
LGASGQIGSALLKILGTQAVSLTRKEADLSQMEGVLAALKKTNPLAVINAAAYTQVDRAESEREIAFQVNAQAPGELAEWTRAAGIPLLHFSSDYVFSGSGTRPWIESDEPGPLNVYGRTKLEGERQIALNGDRFLIFRTSWVYDATGKNFLNTILRLGAEKEELAVVDDQIGAPSFAKDLASHALQALDIALSAKTFPSGVYHMTNAGEVSWNGFAGEICEKARERGVELKVKDLRAISTQAYPTPATRPMNSRLNNTKLKSSFGLELRDWKEALADCMNEKFK